MKSRKARVPRPKQLIGMTDLVDFPDLDLFEVGAKIDTGAYTSALHCKDVRLVRTGDCARLSFRLVYPGTAVPGTGPAPALPVREGSVDSVDHDGVVNERSRRFYSADFTQRVIRNSFGVAEKRYVIRTRIVLFGRVIRAEFTLADRERMRYPVLLGRKLLRNRFIVDVTQKNLSHQAKLTGEKGKD